MIHAAQFRTSNGLGLDLIRRKARDGLVSKRLRGRGAFEKPHRVHDTDRTAQGTEYTRYQDEASGHCYITSVNKRQEDTGRRRTACIDDGPMMRQNVAIGTEYRIGFRVA
jgi:hypothetical protein